MAVGQAEPMIVRRERAGDVDRVRAIHVAAFDRGDGGEAPEAALLDALRTDPGWVPALSIVVEDARGHLIGHVVCTRGRVLAADGRPITGAVGLGPIAVDPAVQRAGAGSTLVHAALGAADALDLPFVALLGSPAYYGRFGFVASTEVGIEAPDPAWGAHFQVRTLHSFDPAQRGRFVYAAPFDSI